jgi:hypothetical protein
LLSRITALLLVMLARARADPEPPSPARAYAHSSTTLLVSTDLSPLPTVGGQLELDATLRVHHRGFAAEVRLGIAAAFSVVAGSDLYGARIGGGVGYAFPIGCRLLLAPMAAYDVMAYRETGGASTQILQRVTIELPLSIVLFPHVVFEPYVQAGVMYVGGNRDAVLVVGPRLGVVF